MTKVVFLFCSNPLDSRTTDEEFLVEYNHVKSLGFDAYLFNYDLLQENNPKLLRNILHQDEPVTAIYRGWMLKPVFYGILYGYLRDKNYKLINTPEQYTTCHYLPHSLRYIKDYTPTTVVFDDGNFEKNIPLLGAAFKNTPIIVKDWVKSCKHNWKDACFINNGSDTAEVKRVTKNFLDLQGFDFNVGLVYRKYEDLKITGTHPVSGMPLANEYRLFFYNHKLIYSTKYWDTNSTTTVIDSWQHVADTIPSNFFTMDVAEKADGSWCIIELGDGQVSGLQTDDPTNFYNGLMKEII